jgi:hypothetical protein
MTQDDQIYTYIYVHSAYISKYIYIYSVSIKYRYVQVILKYMSTLILDRLGKYLEIILATMMIVMYFL